MDQELIFHHNSSLTEILFGSHSYLNAQIVIMFCIGHDSYSAVACAKICGIIIAMNAITLKWIFHGIMNYEVKYIVK